MNMIAIGTRKKTVPSTSIQVCTPLAKRPDYRPTRQESMGNMRVFSAAVAACIGLLLSASASAQSAANGKSIYDSICVSCHGFPPSGGPERANGQASVIQAAINGG